MSLENLSEAKINNDIYSLLKKKQYEIPGFNYEAASLNYYNLHLRKEALHCESDLPVYGARAPPLKTSTFLNIFSMVFDNISLSSVHSKKDKQNFINLANQVKIDELYDILCFLNYKAEFKKMCDIVKEDKNEFIELNNNNIDNDDNQITVIKDIASKLKLNINATLPLPITSIDFTKYYMFIKNLVKIILYNVYNDSSNHNLGLYENINNNEWCINYLTYISILNGDCNQLIQAYKLLCSKKELVDINYSNIPILIYIIVQAYKLLYFGKSIDYLK